MATLSGQQIANRYSSLLKTASDSTLTSALTAVEDGAGNDSDLLISTNKVKVATTLGIGVDPSIGKLHINAGSAQALTIDNGNASFIVGKGTQYSFCIGDCNPVSTVGGGSSSTAAQANSNYISSNTGAHSSAGSMVMMNGSSTGAIGIGKASPSSGLIEIGTGGSGDHQVKVNAPPEASAFEVYSNSETLLSVNGSTKRVGIGENETAPTSTLSIAETGSATNEDGLLSLTNKANAASMIDTRTSMNWNQFYYDGSSPATAKSGKINVGTETNWTSTASTQDSYMAFFTKDGSVSANPAERVRITSAGNVGIGTTTPTQKLHVLGNVLVTGSLTATEISGNSERYVLEEYFKRLPKANASIGLATNLDFELQGQGTPVSAFDGNGLAGVLLTTSGTDGDETVVMPHEDSGQTAWLQLVYPSTAEVSWEAGITLHATAANAKNTVRYVLGLGEKSVAYLQDDQTYARYSNQVIFYYDSDIVSGASFNRFQGTGTTWHCAYSSNGTDYITNLGLTVTEGTTYRFRIDIDESRQASVFINDTQFGLTTISGSGDTGVNVNGTVGLTGGASHVIAVDGTDATTQLVVGDVITNATGVLWGTVTAVTSATSITITAATTKSFSDNSDIYVYGRTAVSTSTKSALLHPAANFTPQVNLVTRHAGTREVTLHYQKISRNLT